MSDPAPMSVGPCPGPGQLVGESTGVPQQLRSLIQLHWQEASGKIFQDSVCKLSGRPYFYGTFESPHIFAYLHGHLVGTGEQMCWEFYQPPPSSFQVPRIPVLCGRGCAGQHFQIFRERTGGFSSLSVKRGSIEPEGWAVCSSHWRLVTGSPPRLPKLLGALIL